MKKTSRILIGLAGLFAAGAVVGALYAPDKGERTRRRIVRKGRWILHSADDAFQEGKDALEEIKDQLKDALEQVEDKAKNMQRCR